jgi:ribose-phosphate pyrophosphokinase
MEGSVNDELKIFTGNAHPELARSICRHLQVPLGACDVFEFSNENVFVKVQENVRQRDVFIVQPWSSPVNTSIMELLIMIDAMKRASAGRVTAVVPYYAYGRSDKKDQPRVPITARLLANLIETAGADRVLTVDLHAGQIQGFFNIPLDELTALYQISSYFKAKKLVNPVVVSADVGFSKRARNVAQSMNAPLAIIEKRRVGNDGDAEALNLIGDVDGCPVIIVDDEIQSGGTLVEGIELLRRRGATTVYAAATHPILSGSAVSLIAKSSVEELVVTDTVPLSEEKRLPKITVLSIAPLMGEAISRIHSGRSVGALFQDEAPDDDDLVAPVQSSSRG